MLDRPHVCKGTKTKQPEEPQGWSQHLTGVAMVGEVLLCFVRSQRADLENLTLKCGANKEKGYGMDFGMNETAFYALETKVKVNFIKGVLAAQW